MDDVFRILSLHLDERCCVIADVGDAMFGAVEFAAARQAQFIAPAYYMSMGFAVPASIGVAHGCQNTAALCLGGRRRVPNDRRRNLHDRSARPQADQSSFSTTMATARCERFAREFNVITQWNYTKVCELVRGGKSTTASTKGEFDSALRRAQKSDDVCVIELKIPRHETSRQLARVASEVRKMRGSKNSRADSRATPGKGLKSDSQVRLAS